MRNLLHGPSIPVTLYPTSSSPNCRVSTSNMKRQVSTACSRRSLQALFLLPWATMTAAQQTLMRRTVFPDLWANSRVGIIITWRASGSTKGGSMMRLPNKQGPTLVDIRSRLITDCALSPLIAVGDILSRLRITAHKQKISGIAQTSIISSTPPTLTTRECSNS